MRDTQVVRLAQVSVTSGLWELMGSLPLFSPPSRSEVVFNTLLLRNTVTVSWFPLTKDQVLFQQSGNLFKLWSLHLCGAWKTFLCSFIVQVALYFCQMQIHILFQLLQIPAECFISSTFLLQVECTQTILWKKKCRKNSTRLFYSTYTLNIFWKLQNEKQLLFANKQL